MEQISSWISVATQTRNSRFYTSITHFFISVFAEVGKSATNKNVPSEFEFTLEYQHSKLRHLSK
jgi:hypothetical protein